MSAVPAKQPTPMTPPTDVKRVVFADPARMKLSEYERQDWVLNVPHGIVPEDLQVPEFWAHMAEQLKPYDHIEVRAEDGTWLAELLVMSCDRTWAKTHLLHFHELSKTDKTFEHTAKFEPEWGGPQAKWRVRRMTDDMVIKEGIPSKDEAIAWLKNHEKTVG